MEWEDATIDGMVKRLAVPGGWLYQSYKSVLNIHEQWDVEPVGLAFVPAVPRTESDGEADGCREGAA